MAIKSVNTVQPKIPKFHPCGKDRHRLYVLKVHGIEVLSMKAGSGNGQEFVLFFFPREYSQLYYVVLILSNPVFNCTEINSPR